MFIMDSLVDKYISIKITFNSDCVITSDPSLELELESSAVSSGPVVRSRVCTTLPLLLESVIVVV